MPNYRFISQGEYYITNDPDTTLVTSGMTECIALSFVSRTHPTYRMLAHMDGAILDSKYVDNNIKFLVDTFKTESKSQDFDIYILGGQKKLENGINLQNAIKKLLLTPTLFSDSREFCEHLNTNLRPTFKFSPTNAIITMVCPPDESPLFMSFNSKYFKPPISDDHLSKGRGLTSPEDQKEYLSFANANKNIIEHYADASHTLRHCKDPEIIKKYGSAPKKDAKPG